MGRRGALGTTRSDGMRTERIAMPGTPLERHRSRGAVAGAAGAGGFGATIVPKPIRPTT